MTRDQVPDSAAKSGRGAQILSSGLAHLIRPAASVAVVFALLIVLVTLVSVYGSTSIENTVSHGLITLILVLGLSTFVGNSGVLSFGHMAFVALAAYGSALITIPPALKGMLLPHLPQFIAGLHLDLALSLPLTIGLVSLVGLATGSFIARLGGAAAAIATLGLLIITNSVIVGAKDITRGSQAIYGVPKEANIWLILACACLTFALVRSFRGSRTGVLLQATREDEPAARAIGIDVVSVRLRAWVLSVAVTALGGVLFAHQLGVFGPKEFYFSQTFAVLVMLIVGGMASTSGAFIGTASVLVIIEVLRHIEEGGIILGIQIPQMFGLTEIGLSVAILFALYRRGTGIMGFAEIEDFLFKRPGLPPRGKIHTGAEIAVHPTVARQVGNQLQVVGATKHYGGVIAVREVNLTLEPCEILGLIGPNGSGKSTLLSLISGAQSLTAGRIILETRDITAKAPHQIARAGIARTFQNIRLFGHLSVIENVEAALLACGRARNRVTSRRMAWALLDSLELTEAAHRHAGTLSYGQQRRVEIARALALAPRYLLLDEPAAGMNEAESNQLVAFLSDLRKREGIGILIVEHDLHMIMRLCDRVAVLNKGELICLGTPAEVRTHPDVMEAYFGRAQKGSAQGARLGTDNT